MIGAPALMDSKAVVPTSFMYVEEVFVTEFNWYIHMVYSFTTYIKGIDYVTNSWSNLQTYSTWEFTLQKKTCRFIAPVRLQ